MSTSRTVCHVLLTAAFVLFSIHGTRADSSSSTTSTSNAPTAAQHRQKLTAIQSAKASVTSGGTADVAPSADISRPIESISAPELFTGTMATSLAIDVPAGRGLIQPALKIIYRSTNSNGWLGVGWDIDAGAIQRSTRFGVSFDCNEDQATKSCFEFTTDDTRQPLVKIAPSQFRFRIDDSSARIRKLIDNSGLIYWELTDRRGTRYTFGSNRESQQEEHGNTFKWALDRVEDANGNFMVFGYTTESGQLYLDHIDYTGNGSVLPRNRVNFILGSRNEFSEMFSSGFGVTTQQRLRFIDVYSLNSRLRRYELRYDESGTTGRSLLTSVTLQGLDGKTLPPVRITYQAQHLSWLSKLVPWPVGVHAGPNPQRAVPSVRPGIRNQCMTGDFNGDGKLDIACYSESATRVWAVALSTSNGWDSTWWPAGPSAGPDVAPMVGWQCITGDFNGDGKTDLACYTGTPGTWHVALSDGTAWHGSPWTNGPTPGLHLGNRHVGNTCVAGDFDGDGKTDLACMDGPNSRRWHVYLSTGSSWSKTWDDGPDGPLGPQQVSTACFIADFNGDGMADMACPSDRPGMLELALSTGSHWKLVVRPGPTGEACAAGDFNGDGIADIACYNAKTGWTVGLGTGDGWDLSSWGLDPLAIGPPGSRKDPQGCLFGDINGDGRTDIACYVLEYSDTGAIAREYWTAGLSTGRGFKPARWTTPYFRYLQASTHQCFDGDFAGTGRITLMCQVAQGVWDALLTDGPPPDLLQSVIGATGSEVRVGYQSTASVYPSPHTDLPFPVNVVSSIESADGRGTSSTTAFSYSGGLYDTPSREFRGFAQVSSVQPTQNSSEQVRIESSFHQGAEPKGQNNDYTGLVGRLARSKTKGPNGELLLDHIFTYRENGGHVPYFNPVAQIDYFTCDGVTCPKHAMLQMDYESNYGNLIREERVPDTSDHTQDVRVERVFLHNDERWIVGLPVTETVSRPGAGANEIVARMQYQYDQGGDCALPDSSNDQVRGNLTSVRQWSTALEYSKWQLSYDAFGNNTCERDPNGGVSRISYDDTFHSLPISLTNALNQPTTFRYYGVGGTPSGGGLVTQLQSVTDANGEVSAFEYDSFGRRIFQLQPDNTRITWSYVDIGRPRTQNIKVVDPNGLTTESYFDGFGRVWRTRSTGPDNQSIVQDTIFSPRGAVKAISVPYLEGKEPPVWAQFSYDPLMRILRAERPDGNFVTRCYAARTSLGVDENGHLHIDVQDAYGRLVRAERYAGTFSDCDHVGALPAPYSSTSYTYNGLGLLSTVLDSNGNETRLSYDGRGLLTKRDDPDFGNWTYGYDANGNVETQTDAEGRSVFLQYDSLNRIVQKDYLRKRHRGKGQFVLSYDTGLNGIGRLAKIRENGSETQFTYDRVGRVIERTRAGKLRKFSIVSAYDAGGRVSSLTYPTGRTANYRYNGPVLAGIEIAGYGEILQSDFDALGRPHKVRFPTGMSEIYTFARKSNPVCRREDFRLCSVAFADESGNTLRRFQYAYDKKGNVARQYEDTAREYRAEYDDYDRLLSVRALPDEPGYPVTYAYDSVGNITFNSHIGTYHYGSAGLHPYAMTQAGNVSFQYDRNGNITRNEHGTLAYDAEGELREVVARHRQSGWFSFLFPKTITSTFTYGFMGDRQIKRETRTLPFPLNWLWPKKKTVYIEPLSQCTGRACEDYVFAQDQLLGTLRAHKKHAAYTFSDVLGSSRLVADARDQLLVTLDYLPFGELHAKSGRDKDDVIERFAGAQFDKSTGLYSFAFRHYDPAVGRFVSPDYATKEFEDPDTRNRYSYVSNNPLTRVDPLGLWDVDTNDVNSVTAAVGEHTMRMMSGLPIAREQPARSGGDSDVQRFQRETTEPFERHRDSALGSSRVGGAATYQSSIERFVASLPTVPASVSNAIQGFGSARSYGITDVINEALGAGGFVDRSSAAYLGGVAVGLLFGATSGPATAAKGAATVAKGVAGTLKGLGNIGSHGIVDAGTALRSAETWLGTGYKEIAPGVFRSADGLRQFRMTARDLLPTHGDIGSHVHFEALDDLGEVIENLHLPVTP